MENIKELEIDLRVTIPDDYVLLKKVDYLKLKKTNKEAEKGRWWTMSDLEKRLGRSREWIRENILLIPEFKKILDVENDGFVYYPRNQGESWAFLASKMSEFLEDNFNDIFTNY